MPTIDYHKDNAQLLHPEVLPNGFGQTLFARIPSPNDVQLAIECARLAYVDATTAPGLKTLADALATIGFGAPKLFSDQRPGGTETFGYGTLRADGKAVLAFRGTQINHIQTLLTDIEAIPVPWPEAGGTVHHGFAQALRSVLQDVGKWVQTQATKAGEPSQLLICGHSLGASLATLAASIFKPASLITIGSPRVGDATFAQALQQTLAMRIVDCCDVVTHLPLEGLHYTHVGSLWYVDRQGTVTHAPADSAVIPDQLRARVDYLFSGLTPSDAISRDLADHAPINYARAFF